MLLTSHPWQPFPGYGAELDRWLAGLGTPVEAHNSPPMAIWEDEDRYHVEVEVPGLQLDQLEVVVVDNELTIKGDFPAAGQQEGTTLHFQERSSGRFQRRVQLPEAVDQQAAEAVLRDGVLSVTLPKSAASKPRRIEVRTKDQDESGKVDG